MNDADRFRLPGRCRTPRVRVGAFVRCLIRGEVEVVGFSDAPIPWPKCKTERWHALIVYAGLACAIRRESAQAVGRWWGVGTDRVWRWRKALGVGATTEGTSRLRSDYSHEPWADEARATMHGQARDADRDAARRGTHHTAETRRKMSEAHRRRGTRPPKAGRPWTAEEDELARTLAPAEAAARTGRTAEAVYCRRAELRAAER